MKIAKKSRALAATGALLIAASACAGPDAEVLGADPGAADPGASAPSVPDAVPAADGPVSTRPPTLGLVVDDGSGAELCLGPVPTSAPPRCDGVPMTGWRWDADRRSFESAGGVRWGEYAVVGTFDGTTLSVTGAVPAALYDAAAPLDAQPRPTADPALTPAEVRDAERSVMTLPGYLGSTTGRDGRLTVDVVFDDGSLQSWADQTYGTGSVTVRGALSASRPGAS